MRTTALVLASIVMLVPATAFAESAKAPENCPPGSVGKASGAFAWCEPTVCVIDTDCGAGMVCRTLGLCMNAGTVGKDAGERLSVTNVCGASKSCPADTVCSEMPRCVEPAYAQRMSLLAPGQAAPASSASAAPPNDMMPKKSACGCTVPGARNDGLAGFAILGFAAIGAAVARRRR
jgi:hypothetical protein